MLPPKCLNNNVTAIITDKWVTETLALWCNCSKQWRPQRELNPGTSWATQDQIKRLNYFRLSLKSKFKIKKSISLSLWTMSVQRDQVQTKSNKWKIGKTFSSRASLIKGQIHYSKHSWMETKCTYSMQFTNYCMCENACMHMYLQKCSFSNAKLSADLQTHSDTKTQVYCYSEHRRTNR